MDENEPMDLALSGITVYLFTSALFLFFLGKEKKREFFYERKDVDGLMNLSDHFDE